MLTGRELLESIELFSETKVIKASGKESVECVSQGLFPASVEILNGSKALYYQQRGITTCLLLAYQYHTIHYLINPNSTLTYLYAFIYKKTQRGKTSLSIVTGKQIGRAHV